MITIIKNLTFKDEPMFADDCLVLLVCLVSGLCITCPFKHVPKATLLVFHNLYFRGFFFFFL